MPAEIAPLCLGLGVTKQLHESTAKTIILEGITQKKDSLTRVRALVNIEDPTQETKLNGTAI
jgi:hypothetical protein